MASIVVSVLTLGVVMAITKSPAAIASASGPSPSFTNAPNEGNCTACHIGSAVNSGGGSVQISGLPAVYSSGQSIPVTVTTSQEDAVVYGFQLTALDQTGQSVGSFTLPAQSPAKMQIVNNIVNGDQREYLEHTVDGILGETFGSNSWTFTWTAPSDTTGEIVFYAAGNAANGNGSPSGDFIYTRSVSIQAAPSSVSISGRVLTSGGQGLRNALVRIVGPQSSLVVLTSTLGYYGFTDLPAGQSYTLSVASKRYRFESRVVEPSADLTNFDFIGLE